MKRTITLLVALVMAMTLMVSVASAEEPYKVGFVMIESIGNSFNIKEVMVKRCAERGWDFVFESADNNNERTIAITQNFITMGCDALLVYSVDIGTMQTVQFMCDNAGVKVSFTGAMEEGYIQVCDNEYQQGIAGAEEMISKVSEKWGEDAKIDLIIVTEATEVGDGNRIRMHEAFVPRLLEEYPYYNEEDVLWVDCALDLLQASSEIANHLSAHPDAKNILIPVFYNASGGQGAMNALLQAGREDDAILVSYHITDRVTYNYIKEMPETWIGSFYFPPESYVDPLFDDVFDVWADGGEVPPQFIYCDFVYVTKDNIDDMGITFDE